LLHQVLIHFLAPIRAWLNRRTMEFSLQEVSKE